MSTPPDPLLVTVYATGHVHLILGHGPLAAARVSTSLKVGARPILIDASPILHPPLQRFVEEGKLIRYQSFELDLLLRLGRSEANRIVDAVFVTDPTDQAGSNGERPDRESGLRDATIESTNQAIQAEESTDHQRHREESTEDRPAHRSVQEIVQFCQWHRIPLNVVDSPQQCSFSLLSTYSDGPLHIGITTSGNGCRLGSRIRREIGTLLPPGLGSAVAKLGALRRQLHAEESLDNEPGSEDDNAEQQSSFNRLVPENTVHGRRTRWLAQMCEYWSLKRLARLSDSDLDRILSQLQTSPDSSQDQHGKGRRIILAGSGPGSPLMLTVATRQAIESASYILADKLVPEAVLDLIPRHTPLHIARKFPGNADAAQLEMLELGLQALKEGHTVLRLKQGDPYVYGRGAEEYAFFASHGYEPQVLPGITSALSGPLFAAIPPTHRNVADQILICTGTGRKGASPAPPRYHDTLTVVFLMALHRLEALIDSLLDQAQGWPPEMPCAVVERASCPDQRVIRTTLGKVCAAVEEQGSRPPGILIVGHVCQVLHLPVRDWSVSEGYLGPG